MENPKPIRPILRVWTHRDYALFMVGCIPNYITFWMQRVGIGWLAWDLTHSTFWLGLVTAIDLAPLLLLAPIAGVLVVGVLCANSGSRRSALWFMLQLCRRFILPGG